MIAVACHRITGGTAIVKKKKAILLRTASFHLLFNLKNNYFITSFLVMASPLL